MPPYSDGIMIDEQPLVPTSETDLLIAAQDGDLEAFEQLQKQLQPPIRRFVQRLISNDDMADDIVQEVFISLYWHMGRIQPPENLRPYLFRMARNRCYDELRRNGRNPSVPLEDEPTNHLWVSFTEPAAKPDDVTYWLLLHLEVREAIDRLPDLQRQALILYAEENLSYAEIAEVMETNIGTIKSRLFHAKKTLRGLLRPETLAALAQEFE